MGHQVTTKLSTSQYMLKLVGLKIKYSYIYLVIRHA